MWPKDVIIRIYEPYKGNEKINVKDTDMG